MLYWYGFTIRAWKWGEQMREVRCNQCGRLINSRGDLYTYLSLSGIQGSCSDCYLRDQKTLRGGRMPINSQSTIFVMVAVIVACTLLFIKNPSWVWVIVALIVPIIRILSWMLIERKIKIY